MHRSRTAPVRADAPRTTEGEPSGNHPPPRARGGWARGLATSRMLRFAVVGGAGVVVNTAALYALHRLLHVPLVPASAMAVELAVINNYVLNDRWTFGMRALSLKRFGKFNASMLAGLAVNVLVLWALVHGGHHLVLANVIAIGAAFAVNYTSSALWVWHGTWGRNR